MSRGADVDARSSGDDAPVRARAPPTSTHGSPRNTGGHRAGRAPHRALRQNVGPLLA